MRSTLMLAVGATALTLISLPLAAAPAPAAAAATASNWQAISAEPGKRIEIDRSSIKKDASGKTTAWGRVILERELHDAKSGGAYKIIEAMNRYDCEARAYATVKRVYLKNEGEILREEDTGAQSELPARAGTLDEKLLREVCRPQSPSDLAKVAQKTTDKITAATYDLKQANEERLKKEAEKDKRKVVKAEKTDKADAEEMAPPVVKPRVRSAAPRPVAKKAAPAKSDKMADKAGQEEKVEVKHEHSALQAHWAYEGEGGPDKWGSLSADYSTCAKGQRQSPIDIRDGIRVDVPAIKFDYQPSMFRIVDNGHTIQVAVGGGSITLMGKTYELVQFHFHRPSEERINGQAYDMVAHLVHKSADGKLAVVAVLLEIGKPNPVIKTLWDYMPLERNDEVAPTDVAIDLNLLLPPAPNRNYFTYMGSLTTPPCTEGVLWMVLKEPMTVSAEQNSIFARLYRNNARPIQPANGRLIKEAR